MTYQINNSFAYDVDDSNAVSPNPRDDSRAEKAGKGPVLATKLPKTTGDLSPKNKTSIEEESARPPTEQPQGKSKTAEEISLLGEMANGLIEKLQAVCSTLIPSYQAAIDALDPVGAQDLSAKSLIVCQTADQIRNRMRSLLDSNHQDYWKNYLLPLPTDEIASRESIRAPLGALDLTLTITQQQLACVFAAQRFRGREVMQDQTAPIVLGAHAIDRLGFEAIHTCSLIAVVKDVVSAIPLSSDGNSSGLSDGDRQTIAAKIAQYRGRPIAMAFIRVALTEEGRWEYIEQAVSPDGRTISQLDASAMMQAEHTGAMVSVGEFREEIVLQLLPRTLNPYGYDVGDGSEAPKGASTENAIKVFKMIMSADPEARPGLVVRLERLSVLSALCANALPFALTEQLFDSLPTGTEHSREAKTLLRPYFENKGGGRSLSKIYGEWGTAGSVLGFAHNVGTFGFLSSHDQAYDQRAAGLMSDNQYETALAASLVKTGASAGVSMATGGAAGAYAEGFAKQMIASRVATNGLLGRLLPTVVGGAAEGAVGGVSARMAGDSVDLLTTGTTKSSSSDYVDDTLLGLGVGGGASAVLGGLGAGARYLPAGVVTRLQKLALRFPRHESFFDDLRQLGANHATTVRVTVRKLYELSRDGILPPGSAQFALTEIQTTPGRFVNLDDQIDLTIESLNRLDEAGDVDGSPLRVRKAERITEDGVSSPDEAVSRFPEGSADSLDDVAVLEAATRAAATKQLMDIEIHFAAKGRDAKFDSYYIRPADGEQLTELLKVVAPEIKVKHYKKGLLIRGNGQDWYFEFSDQAAQPGRERATAIDSTDGGFGLPKPNVAVIEVWGFRGVRTIQKAGDPVPRPPTPEERAMIAEMVEKYPLLGAGHVSMSIDGGKTLRGWTPDWPKEMVNGVSEYIPLETFKTRLKNKEAFRGRFGDDTEIFQRAELLAKEHGWNTEIVKIDEIVEPTQMQEISAAMADLEAGKHNQAYSWPLETPINGEYFAASNGYAASDVRNCATFLEKLGVKLPERSGNMIKFMPALSDWRSAEAPIDARRGGH